MDSQFFDAYGCGSVGIGVWSVFWWKSYLYAFKLVVTQCAGKPLVKSQEKQFVNKMQLKVLGLHEPSSFYVFVELPNLLTARPWLVAVAPYTTK